jgi:DNA (cytosine-5)-methyltransferase 1
VRGQGAASGSGFTFVDLFSGVGGFHAALSGLGGAAVFASEIDTAAAGVYERNWGLRPHGDIVQLTERRMDVPASDLVVGGFPCQPFSKSGAQRGMDETRGTLFFNICRVLEAHRPPMIVLENVRNLSGARQRSAWLTIIRSLRDLGYLVASEPAVMSPHLLPPSAGGSPQFRERAFITGTYVGPERAWAEPVDPVANNRPVGGWDPHDWDLVRDLPMDDSPDATAQ